MQEKDAYVCNTYYHLLISIVKQMKNNIKSDIIFVMNRKSEYRLIQNYQMMKKLNAVGLFDNILTLDFSDLFCGFRHIFKFIKSKKYIDKKIKNHEIDFSKYKNVYIFADAGFMA